MVARIPKRCLLNGRFTMAAKWNRVRPTNSPSDPATTISPIGRTTAAGLSTRNMTDDVVDYGRSIRSPCRQAADYRPVR